MMTQTHARNESTSGSDQASANNEKQKGIMNS